MYDDKILITYGFHPGEYTQAVAKRLAERLTTAGYDVELRKVPYSENGWSAALNGSSYEDINWKMTGLGYIEKVLREFQSGVILDMHTCDERVLNPNYLPPEDFSFLELYEDPPKDAKAAVLYHQWPWEAIEKFASDKIRGYTIELPQVYRRVSKRFLDSISKRSGLVFNFPEKMKVTNELHSYFMYVCDKKATEKKYDFDALTDIVYNGVVDRILNK